MKIICRKQVHGGWDEWMKVAEDPEYKKIMDKYGGSIFKKWQYIYKVKGLDMYVSLICFNSKNTIVELYKENPWEVYASNNSDVCRFKTKKIAEAYIKSIFIGLVDID